MLQDGIKNSEQSHPETIPRIYKSPDREREREVRVKKKGREGDFGRSMKGKCEVLDGRRRKEIGRAHV